MAELDKNKVIQQIVQLQKEFGETSKYLDFHYFPLKRTDPLSSLFKTIEGLRNRQENLDKRLRFIEKFVLSS